MEGFISDSCLNTRFLTPEGDFRSTKNSFFAWFNSSLVITPVYNSFALLENTIRTTKSEVKSPHTISFSDLAKEINFPILDV